jgi:hypothetical protein
MADAVATGGRFGCSLPPRPRRVPGATGEVVRERGAALIELAIALPILVLIVFASSSSASPIRTAAGERST